MKVTSKGIYVFRESDESFFVINENIPRRELSDG